MRALTDVEHLAREFSRLLVLALGKKRVLRIARKNKLETDPKVCHSHDICDANMIMLEAHQNIGLDPGDSPDDVKLWNDAWSEAVRNSFFLKS